MTSTLLGIVTRAGAPPPKSKKTRLCPHTSHHCPPTPQALQILSMPATPHLPHTSHTPPRLSHPGVSTWVPVLFSVSVSVSISVSISVSVCVSVSISVVVYVCEVIGRHEKEEMIQQDICPALASLARWGGGDALGARDNQSVHVVLECYLVLAAGVGLAHRARIITHTPSLVVLRAQLVSSIHGVYGKEEQNQRLLILQILASLQTGFWVCLWVWVWVWVRVWVWVWVWV